MANPTMADLEKDDPIQPGPDPNPAPVLTPNPEPEPDPKPEPDPDPTEEEKAAARLAELQGKDQATLTDAEKAELETLTAEPAEETTIWEDVDALRGESLEIDWSQYKDETGNPIDPDTPQGIFIREKHLEQRAVQRFEENLQKTDPRGYAYFLHRQAGGTDEDFFARKTVDLPEYDTFKESVDLQKKVYEEDLRIKGVSEKQIKLLSDQALKDKELFELADAAYKSRQQAQQKELDDIAAQLKKDQEEYDRQVAAFSTRLTKEITSNANMKFLIPEAKKAVFNDFVRQRIQYDNGRFYLVQPVGDDFARALEGLYLQMVDGDLTGLVKRTAQSQNAKKFVKKVQQSAKGPANSSTPNTSSSKIPIAEM